ncbi:hypothetical protein BO79DRAFT_256630 [Aspergillus costaricaensis CBS 115574]|uniref:Uncharacterized protein n=1 Tax=Aspergillus costaricaensis CBS 115574 TaxID=1448317 RepID=A0ACD1IA30_9EURO|nr:hypothetical protein BO79DRAFT_256630 [Aspergillus costaricaensis CBS 115574]RAK87135.1 hypothetical protein BO79DRAFT_256630 [Aspergillus costaricaensis CBS 115574]
MALAGVEDIPKDLSRDWTHAPPKGNLYYGHNHHMYGGPKAHVLHFPVAKQKLLNIVAFVNDPTDWPLGQPMSEPATKDEVAVVFSDWGPTVRSIIDLLTSELDI